jgi:RsiW-degrading membrane proteinase PrsW (M82 family)
MRNPVLRLYLAARKPRNFIKVLCIFIVVSLSLHFLRGYDPEWGSTNLIMSIEATIAGAVMLMVQEESAEMHARMLTALVDMAQAQRDMLADHAALLRTLKEGDERLLKTLTGMEE